jgi:hypothetical protein
MPYNVSIGPFDSMRMDSDETHSMAIRLRTLYIMLVQKRVKGEAGGTNSQRDE